MKQIRIQPENEPRTLLQLLQAQGVFLSAACGGRGTCGKCKVRFAEGAPEPSGPDLARLSADEIRSGWRLACRTYITKPCVIELDPQAEEAIAVGTAFRRTAETAGSGTVPETAVPVLAVDIGTTTLAAALICPGAQPPYPVATSVNHQRSFGSDVISRIDASNKGNREALQALILQDLEALGAQLGIPEQDIFDPEKIRLIISGNSTMQHLLQGLSCESLGVAPYTPVDISLHPWRNMTLLPGISTFVGADIVSGVIACDMDRKDDICLLIDLGTNGEMVLGNRSRMLCASTAAGPAFEGGNISCGTAGIPGAICAAEIGAADPIRTIGDLPPVGICGSGVLEVTYELLRCGLIDETGLLDDDYFDEGYPLGEGLFFTAKDVREVQLAKSAIASGIQVLLHEYGIGSDDVSRVYLAGGFGEKVNIRKAVGIGLLPEDLADRTRPVGNSSLAGAVLFSEQPDLAARFAQAASGIREVSLTETPLFSELYMDNMFFPEQ